MLALTLKHPWPWAICVAGKDVENRTWAPRQLRRGDRFAIHGGKQPREHSSAWRDADSSKSCPRCSSPPKEPEPAPAASSYAPDYELSVIEEALYVLSQLGPQARARAIAYLHVRLQQA